MTGEANVIWRPMLIFQKEANVSEVNVSEANVIAPLLINRNTIVTVQWHSQEMCWAPNVLGDFSFQISH